MVSQAASGLAWGYKAVSGPRPGCNELQGFGTNMWDLIRGHQDWWLHIRHVYFQVGSCKEGGFSCMKVPGLPPSCMYFYKIVNCAYFLIIPCIHWEWMSEKYSQWPTLWLVSGPIEMASMFPLNPDPQHSMRIRRSDVQVLLTYEFHITQ